MKTRGSYVTVSYVNPPRLYSAREKSPLDPPDAVIGTYHGSGKNWTRHVKVDVSDIKYSSVKDAIETLTAAGEGLVNASLDAESSDDYGSETIRLTVTGERPATADEVVWIKKQIARDKAAWELREQAEIAAFRMKHPDLFP